MGVSTHAGRALGFLRIPVIGWAEAIAKRVSNMNKPVVVGPQEVLYLAFGVEPWGADADSANNCNAGGVVVEEHGPNNSLVSVFCELCACFRVGGGINNDG